MTTDSSKNSFYDFTIGDWLRWRRRGRSWYLLVGSRVWWGPKPKKSPGVKAAHQEREA